MPSFKANARRAEAGDASSGLDRLDKLLAETLFTETLFTETLFAETDAAPAPPGAQAVSDALSRNAISRAGSAPRGETVRLIDLERRARFGRCGFGAV